MLKRFTGYSMPALAVLLLAGPALAETSGDATAGTVKLELSGLQDAAGNVYVSVYDSDDSWLGDDTVLTQKVVIADALQGEVVVTELQLAPGEYAISVFYDSNDNGELDTNFIGIPKEPVALSNNARPSFGPPKYKDAVFTVGDELVVQSISMEDI